MLNWKTFSTFFQHFSQMSDRGSYFFYMAFSVAFVQCLHGCEQVWLHVHMWTGTYTQCVYQRRTSHIVFDHSPPYSLDTISVTVKGGFCVSPISF